MKKTIIAIIGTSLLAGVAGADTAVYTQTFDNATSGNVLLSTVDWNANYTTSGTSYTVLDGNGPFVSNGDFLFANKRDMPWLAWTDDASFGSISDITTMSMSLNNTNSTTENLQFALQVDGNWYVSQSVFNGNGNVVVSLDVQAASWSSLTFTADTSLAVGATATLPVSGTLQAVGVYDNDQSLQVRVDNFTVSVPEPSAAGVLLGLGALVTVAARRRV
ncbi:PEP-CTERM sorting domain-containing protein [Coraliomargarita sp. W4R53]